MNEYWVWVIVSFYVAAAWVAVAWIRARYGGASYQPGLDSQGTADICSLLSAMRARDTRIERLEQRVRVLERIATDSSAQLSREFAQLGS